MNLNESKQLKLRLLMKKKLYRNMGENSMKMYAEDLLFQFQEGVPDYLFDEAMTRLIKSAENPTQDDVLNYR